MELRLWTEDSIRTLAVVYASVMFCGPHNVAGDNGTEVVDRRFDDKTGCDTCRDIFLTPEISWEMMTPRLCKRDSFRILVPVYAWGNFLAP